MSAKIPVEIILPQKSVITGNTTDHIPKVCSKIEIGSLSFQNHWKQIMRFLTNKRSNFLFPTNDLGEALRWLFEKMQTHFGAQKWKEQ